MRLLATVLFTFIIGQLTIAQDGGTATAKIKWGNGETTEETVYIPIADSEKGIPDYMDMQMGFDYLGENGDKVKIGIGDIERMDMNYRDKDYVFISTMYNGMRRIMHCTVDDKLRMLNYHYESRDTETHIVTENISRVLSIEGGDQGKNTKIYVMGFKGAMKEFFSDYPDMVEKVKKKEFRYKNVNDMVKYFNSKYGKNAE